MRTDDDGRPVAVEVEPPDTGDPGPPVMPEANDVLRDVVGGMIGEALVLAREAADAWRASNPRRGRQASLVATRLEEAYLFAKWGDQT